MRIGGAAHVKLPAPSSRMALPAQAVAAARAPHVAARTMLLAPLALLGGLGALLGAEILIARDVAQPTHPNFDLDHTFPGAEPTIELAVVGDSTVAGLGAADADDTLPLQVGRELAQRTGRAVHVRGYGVSGATTQDVVDEQLPQIPTGFDVIVFEIGTNDVIHLTQLDELERQTQRMLEEGAERAPLVILGSVARLDTPNFLRPLQDIVVARANQVRERQRAAAGDAGIGFVELGGVPIATQFSQTPGAISSDQFHPAGPGYGVWASALADEAERLIEESTAQPSP